MRVIEPQETGRKTVVELTDREVQYITRALLEDRSNSDENVILFDEFKKLRERLGLSQLSK